MKNVTQILPMHGQIDAGDHHFIHDYCICMHGHLPGPRALVRLSPESSSAGGGTVLVCAVCLVVRSVCVVKLAHDLHTHVRTPVLYI